MSLDNDQRNEVAGPVPTETRVADASRTQSRLGGADPVEPNAKEAQRTQAPMTESAAKDAADNETLPSCELSLAASGKTSEKTAPGGSFVFVVDDEASICNFVAKTLNSLGVECETFHTAKSALSGLARRFPSIILLDVALMQSDAIDVVHGLGDARYDGVIHLMSGGNPSLVEAVQRIGARKGLAFGRPLNKPFRRDALLRLFTEIGLAKSL